MPKRIQRRRSKGWRLPAGAVVVTRPGKWGNPYKVDMSISHHSPDQCVGRYELHLRTGKLHISVEDVRRELRGKDLACWCRLDQACHADVLLRVANGPG